jgi:hypothetical protein
VIAAASETKRTTGETCGIARASGKTHASHQTLFLLAVARARSPSGRGLITVLWEQ